MQTNCFSKDVERKSIASCVDHAVAKDSSPTLWRTHRPGIVHAVAQKSSPPQCRAELCGTAVIENRAEGDRTAAAVIEKRAADEFPETDFSKFTKRSVQQQTTPFAPSRRDVEKEIFEKNPQEGRERPSQCRTNNNIY